MSQRTNFWHRLLVAASCGVATFAGSTLMAADKMTIGSDAPALDIEHWVQDGGGKFKPVTKFENNKVYVVEFWATWCGPCVASMPHIAKMQKDYADKGVQIVSISDEDLDTVEEFLEGDLPSNNPEASDKIKTYKDLTKSYCLTADPDRSCHKDYMQAAGQNGIPCAFIVGKDQKIEWIGHPMSMDSVLESVVEGKWDRQAFAEEFKKRAEMEALMGQIRRSMGQGKVKDALAKVEAFLETSKDPAMTKQFKLIRLQIIMSDSNSNDKLAEILPSALEENADNPQLINMIAWTLYEKTEAGSIDDKPLLKLSLKAAEKASVAADAESKAAILDTVSHLQFVSGDIDGAIATQEKAIDAADDQLKGELQKFLKELKAAKKK